MPDFVATYDLRRTTPAPHSEFVKQARLRGWQQWITNGTNWYQLPNTTLEGSFPTMADASTSLKQVRADTEKALGITVTMEKWVITPSDTARFDSDVSQPKK